MIITEITRNIKNEVVNKRCDLLMIEWYESTKRIQRLRTEEGMDIAFKLLGNTSQLHDGDILYEDADKIVVIAIRACDVICIEMLNFLEIAFISCEIGNKHLPLFVEGNELLIPFERTMQTWLDKQDVSYTLASRQLLRQLNAHVDANYHRRLKSSTKGIPLFIKA
ncbi:hypothetical protein SF1_25430 [Sphingobacterium faecium NBRC 15299]|uniref:urease accessory protein UreE n=1 Tax=Sphingobacterium faecium TaxID=34087 RepID=UPI000D37A919|nr:urease accessory protein UreE [Sphingobacterium faecium]PTX11570.1 urease accessory protein [Sphingobacterium faecium]GEM64561.1 hypothetical protein SF1_25430 [Sphingobacterium faecium NBRC 15299]